MKHLLAFLALALVPLVSCASSKEAPAPGAEGPRKVAFASLAHQTQSGLMEPERTVIRTAQAWEEAWKRINTYLIPAPPMPAVDFSRQMVVLVALGERPTEGWSVEVTEALLEGGFLRVRARIHEPDANAPQAQVLTHPFDAVRLSRVEGPVEISVQ